MADKEDIQRVQELIDANNLNMKAVSLAAGLGPTFVRDMLKRDRQPSLENYKKVMDAIARLSGRVLLDPPSSDVAPADYEQPYRNQLPRDIDVVAAVAGSDPARGSFQFSMDPIDRVARPPGLIGVKGAYAAFVENDSMYPMYQPGQLVYASRVRPPAPGDAVIIQNYGENEGDFGGFIKLLVRRTADWVECKQFNPEGPVKYRNHKGLILHRVYTTNELFGI
ncbi:helix-turn-helix transcriptional regulator [Devosia sp. 1635]|uniref:S24 family peptidase n=1 Tax=Devosia sp. 1635 TaxID=2726066 RepID=UPI0015634CAC|nr:helix-turn-helix transcriptional regulator [Devosia sp. 1635]